MDDEWSYHHPSQAPPIPSSGSVLVGDWTASNTGWRDDWDDTRAQPPPPPLTTLIGPARLLTAIAHRDDGVHPSPGLLPTPILRDLKTLDPPGLLDNM